MPPRRLNMNRGGSQARGGARGRGRGRGRGVSTKSVAAFYAQTAQLDKRQRQEKVKQATYTYQALMGKLLKQQNQERVILIDE